MRIAVAGHGAAPLKLARELRRRHGAVVACVYLPGDDIRRLRPQAAGFELLPIEGIGRRRPAPPTQLDCDLLLSFNSLTVFSDTAIASPQLGALNFHGGRLPEYAGIHVHQRMILDDERSAAATIHWMTPSVDAGDIVSESEVPISPRETGFSLLEKIVAAAYEPMLAAVGRLIKGQPLPARQQDLGSRRYYGLSSFPSGEMDWARDSGYLDRFIRAADYRPLASPTYTPRTASPLGPLDPLSASPGMAAEEAPAGTILACTTEGVDVACGGGAALRLTAFRLAGRAYAAPGLGACGLKAGIRLGTGGTG